MHCYVAGMMVLHRSRIPKNRLARKNQMQCNLLFGPGRIYGGRRCADLYSPFGSVLGWEVTLRGRLLECGL